MPLKKETGKDLGYGTYGYTDEELGFDQAKYRAWYNSKGGDSGKRNSVKDYRELLGYSKRYNEDPDFRGRTDSERKSGFTEKLKGHTSRIGSGVEDFAKAAGPTAAVMGGLGYLSAAGGAFGGTVGAGAPTAMTGSTVTGMGGVSATNALGAAAGGAGYGSYGAAGGEFGGAGVPTTGGINPVSNIPTSAGIKPATSFLSGAGGDTARDLLGLWGNYQSNSDTKDSLKQGFGQQNPWAEHQQEFGEKLRGLEADPSSIANTPGYKFALDQGLESLWAKQASTGNTFSGRAMEETMQFGTGLASQMYQSEMDRYGKLSGAYQPNTGGVETGFANAQNNNQNWFNNFSTISDIWSRYN